MVGVFAGFDAPGGEQGTDFPYGLFLKSLGG